MQSDRRGAGSWRRFLPYIAAFLIMYGAVGVAVNLRLGALLIEALSGWFGGKSAWDAALSLGFLGPLQAHYDALPALPWAAWLAGIALLGFIPPAAPEAELPVRDAGPLPLPQAPGTRKAALVAGIALVVLVLLGGVGRMAELWPQNYGITRWPYDDEGVYAGASQLFIQGIVPYRDYFFAHPPIAAIAYAPAMAYHFTEWGSPTSFMMARYLSVFYSLITLALIFLIAYRLAGLWGGVMAGGLWAIDGRVVEINRKIMLEGPLVLLSCASVLLYLWVRPALEGKPGGPRRPLLMLGLAAAVAALSALTKIAGLACLLAILADMLWLWLEQRRISKADRPVRGFGRQLLAVLLGAVVAALVVAGPFVVLAPSQFAREVFFFQMLRPGDGVVDVPARIGDLTASLANALTPLAASLGFIVLSAWAWVRRGLGPWRVGILWTFFSLLLFTYSRSFYQHYYIQLAAPLCLLGAGVTLLPRLRLAYYRRDVSAPASTGAPVPARLAITAPDLARGAIPAVVLALLAIPLLLLQWSGMTTRNCPHCSDPMFEIVGRYVNDAVPPGSPVLATDEQFDLLAARAPSRNDTGYLIDSYGHMIYLGLELNNRDWGDLISSSLKGEHGNDPYAVMHLPVPQADFLDRASRAAMMVVHDRGLARLTSATVDALRQQADIAEQQSRYTIYRAR